MLKASKLEEAFRLLATAPGSSNDPPRIWGGEYAPFTGDRGVEISGIRYYLVGSTEAMYAHIASQRSAERRNFYEVITAGLCHFYADYDLKTPSTTSVAAAHAAFSASLRAMLDPAVVASISENILVGHIPGRKESMHVRWEFRSPTGEIVALSTPEDGRRIASCAILHSVPYNADGELDYLASPLFYADPETGRPVCVLDIGVYNNNRNFRLAGNVKPKAPGECRGWLVPAEQNAAGGGADTVMPSREVFYKNLVCYFPPEERQSVKVLDVSEFPDGMDNIRKDMLGKNKPASGPRPAKGGEDALIPRSSASKSVAIEFHRRIEEIMENILAAKAKEDVSTVDRRGGVMTMRIDGCYCSIKGADHEDARNGYYIARMGYPMMRAYRRCWKTKCIESQKQNPPAAEELGENEDYRAEAERLMKSTPASTGESFLVF